MNDPGLLFTILVVVAAVAWVVRVWRVKAERGDFEEDTSFRVAFEDGRVAGVKGRVPRTIYGAFEEVAVLSRATGEVRVSDDAEISFSSTIPDAARQQFRNVFWASRR